MPNIDLSILNQRQTPAFFADTLANRPAAGFLGRIFVSTDTFAFYRDNGTGWDLIGGPGTGTITGSGTAGTIPLWSGASTIGNSDLRQLSSEALILNSATNDWPTTNFSNDPGRFLITSATNNPFLILWGKSAFGSSDEQGSIALGNVTALGSTTFGGALLNGYIENATNGAGALEIRTTNTSGVETLALTINSTQNTIFNNSIGINTSTPGAAIDVHSGVNVIQQLNQTIATNNSLLAFQNSGTGLWRIGSFYNSGANDFGIFDIVGSAEQFSIKKTTGQTFIGAQTTTSGRLVVNNATGDNHIVVIGATAPSLRINNSGSGATKQIGIGLATATNNFIQGAVDRDMAIFNGSTTPSPILFGIYDAGAGNTQEAARISTARNLLVGTSVDSGEKLIVSGATKITSSLSVNGVGDFNTSSSSTYDFAIRNSGSGVTRLRMGNSTSTARLTITLGATGSEFARIGPEGNFPMYFQTNGSDRMTIIGTGNVGINNVSPNAQLQISGDGIAQNQLRLNHTGSGTNGFLDIGVYDTRAVISTNYSSTNIPLEIKSLGNTNQLYLATTSNVLVGTSVDNGNKFRVNGTAEAIKFQGSVNTISNSTNPFASITNGGQTYFQGTLSNGQQFGSTSGTYVVGIYFIFYYDSTTDLRGSAIYMAGNAVALGGFNLVTQTGALNFSATYNAAASISLAFDAALRGPILTNNTTNSLLFYAYVLGGS